MTGADRSTARALEVLAITASPTGPTAPPPLPAGFADRLVRAAVSARAAGRPTGPWAATLESPVTSLTRTQDELGELLDGLDDADWQRGPLRVGEHDWAVRDLVAHLVASERYTAALLGDGVWAPPTGLEADHNGMTLDTVAALAGEPIAKVRSAWREATDRVGRAARHKAAEGDGLDQQVAFATIPMRVRSLLVVRTFEVWSHSDDIRRAVGLPLAAPDAGRLTLMSDVAVRALPLGLALAGRPRPGRTARVVLTGPGGGTWSQPLGLGEEAGDPDLLIVADVVDFCRLAARRLEPADLQFAADGDGNLLDDLLVGAGVFAG